jgi:hypothetical protein
LHSNLTLLALRYRKQAHRYSALFLSLTQSTRAIYSMAEKFTKPEARGSGIHEHDVPEKAESVSDDEAIESTPSSVEQSIHQPNRLPPRPARGAKEREYRRAAAILEEYQESDLEEQKCMYRQCFDQKGASC